jgi:tripartite-type tricarboxylate transporter receptor subunit TctC
MTSTLLRAAAPVLAAAGIVLAATPSPADAVADFYSGRTVTIVVAAGPGGGHSVYSQLIAPAVQKHLPGNPKLIIQNMGGAGGTKAANYLATAAAQDGSYIGILLSDTPLSARIRATGIKYDPSKFQYLGGADITRSAFVVLKSAGVNTIEDAKKKEVLVGSTGKSSQTFVVPTVVNAILGTKFKPVLGYRGMGDIYLAVDRKEVQGFANVWSAVTYLRENWVKDDLVTVIATISPDPLPDLPKVPKITDMVKDPLDRKLIELIAGNGVLGRGWLAPPGAPKDRVTALRAAFAAAFKDPEAIAAAKARKLPWETASWQDMQAQVDTIMKTDKAVIDRMKSILGAK